MTKADHVTDYLHDILDYAARAEHFVEGMNLTTFAADEKTQAAVLYAFTIVGEAANKIPAHVREHYPSLPWRDMITMRNRLIHGYHGIDFKVVWDTIHYDLPMLREQIAAMLAELEP